MSASFSSTPRTALVTGAGKRLGREIALGLARAGWRVAVHYRSSEAEALQTAADCLQAFAQWQAQAGLKVEGGDASVVQNSAQLQLQNFIFKADLANEEDARKLLPQVVSQLGRVDAVINSAALFEHDDVQSFSYANMAQHWASNTGAAIVLAQALHQHCQSRGAQAAEAVQLARTVAEKLGHIGEGRTLGYSAHGAAGMLTLFVRAVMCNWMVSMGVVGAMISTSVSGKVIAMWMPIMLFFFMGFEHSVVNMFLFPSAMIMGGDFSLMDYLVWNEIPTVLGNLVGGLAFTGLTLYGTHIRTAAKKVTSATTC